MTDSIQVALSGREFTVARARLGGYLALQGAQEHIDHAVQAQDNGRIADGLFLYLRIALADLEREAYEALPWFEVLTAYDAISALNRIPEATKFSILRRIEERKGRSVVWLHIIASTYHWSKAEIESLWPEDAIAFIQEIMVDEQLDREFLHSLSEVAYQYDKASKKSRYKPMNRPLFMVLRTDEPRRTLLHRAMLPVGKVVYPDDADPTLKPADE
jgi:hypothetical protein